MFVIPIIPVTPAILVTLFPALTLVGRQNKGLPLLWKPLASSH